MSGNFCKASKEPVAKSDIIGKPFSLVINSSFCPRFILLKFFSPTNVSAMYSNSGLFILVLILLLLKVSCNALRLTSILSASCCIDLMTPVFSSTL